MKNNMWLDFKITNRCNNNCVYCGVKHDKVTETELVSMNFLVETVKSALKIGFKNFAFLGGEPTVRENVETLFTAFDKPVDANVLIITNGLVFNENLVESAFACQAKNVYIVQSFDNFETPNYKRQNPSKILVNISRIQEIAKKNKGKDINRGVCIHSVISKENYTKVYELVNYFNERDVDISVGLVCPSKFDNTPNPIEYNHFNFVELDIILNQFKRLETENKLNFANKVLYEYLQLYPFRKVSIKGICRAGKEHVIINPDGEVYPCITQSYARNAKYGNIKEIPFDIIYSKLQDFECDIDFAPACYDHYLWNQLK
jgi:MoaA/NifB/PqqE/SkfB family radical SAM enzyme